MSNFKRRKFLKTSAGMAAAAAVGPMIWVKDANAQWKNVPEKGAKLRVLRWSRFVQGDIDQYMKNVAKFTEKTGIEVRIDNEGWEDVRPKAAVAANTGAGPDIILSTNDDANLYPEKLAGDEPEELEVVPWKMSQLHDLIACHDVSEGRSIAALFIAREYLAGRYRPQR